MSGIAGILVLDGDVARPVQMQAMLSMLARRGPDRQGLHCEAAIALGQTLLATTPEALAEQQPWCHPDDGCIVVSDSRLDNRPELLRALDIADGDADAIGDGRLLHAAWRRWGEDCPLQLLGDFAFSIWDPLRQVLFCARDTAGVRPLYFHHAPGKLFAFASEPGALLALREVPADLDEIRLVDGLLPQLQGLDDTGTPYKAIRRCPPAHSMLLEAGRLRIREYWTPFLSGPADLPIDDQAWAEGLRHHFEQAVLCRLRSHGPLGSMLSGGLDSSSVVAVASRQLADAGRARLHAFSAINPVADCPETTAIRCMVDAFPVQSHCLDVGAASGFLDDIVRDWGKLAQPSDAMMAMVDCQYRMATAQGCRIVFDGSNADALLFEGHLLAGLLRRGRWLAAYAEARGQDGFYREGWGTWGYLKSELVEAFLHERIRLVLRRWRQPAMIRRRLNEALLAPDFIRRSGLEARLLAIGSQSPVPVATSRDGRGESWLMSSHGIAGIERYGRLAAAQGVETRHPFMDRRLVEFCAWIPARLRLRGGWPKWLLRRALGSMLPESIAWRRGKEHLGWRYNHAAFARAGALQPIVAGMRADATGMFRPECQPLWNAGMASGDLPEDWEARLAAAAILVWRSGKA